MNQIFELPPLKFDFNALEPAIDAKTMEIHHDKHHAAYVNNLNKALDGLVGCNYEAVAYIGSQVVAGTNYSILCRTTPVVPDAVSSFSIVTVYEDLNGSAELTDVSDLTL